MAKWCGFFSLWDDKFVLKLVSVVVVQFCIYLKPLDCTLYLFRQYLDMNSGPCSYWGRILPFEPYLQPGLYTF
jgi:hypothetical protein